MIEDNQRQSIIAYVDKLKPRLIGRIIYALNIYRKKVVMKNIELVFSDILNKKQMKKLAQSFYSHLFITLKDTFLLYTFWPEVDINRAIINVNFNDSDPNYWQKPSFLLTAHLGNWEITGAIMAYHLTKNQGKLCLIRKPFNHRFKLIKKKIENKITKYGIQSLSNHNVIENLMTTIENNYHVFFAFDQHAAGKKGIDLDFFGKPARTYKSLALLVQHTKLPVHVCYSYRLQNGDTVIEIDRLDSWKTATTGKEEIKLNTLSYNKAIEKMIIKHPEQWLWSHKRWKTSIDYSNVSS